jgi:hypothetical protein
VHHDACWKFDHSTHQALCHARWFEPDGAAYYTAAAQALAPYSNNTTATNFEEFRWLLRVIQGQFGFSTHPLPPDHAERVAFAEAALEALRPFVVKPRKLFWRAGG